MHYLGGDQTLVCMGTSLVLIPEACGLYSPSFEERRVQGTCGIAPDDVNALLLNQVRFRLGTTVPVLDTSMSAGQRYPAR
jgi:hypothetical protein